MENIQDFHEKKKNWVTFEDKKNDIAPFLKKVLANLRCEKPDPLMKQEDLLKAIINELECDYDVERARMDVRTEAYFSHLKEIYKMPGCIDELVEQLKAHPTLGTYETDMITEEWYAQYSDDRRELSKDSSTPEKEIKERDDFLKSKCVEIAKAWAERQQLVPQLREVDSLLQMANILFNLALKLPVNKDGSSPSRKKFSSGEDSSSFGEDSSSSSSSSSSGEDSSSSSGEDSSSSSRESKRARK